MTTQTTQDPKDQQHQEPKSSGIDFDSDTPIPACPIRKPGDGDICEACQ